MFIAIVLQNSSFPLHFHWLRLCFWQLAPYGLVDWTVYLEVRASKRWSWIVIICWLLNNQDFFYFSWCGMQVNQKKKPTSSTLLGFKNNPEFHVIFTWGKAMKTKWWNIFSKIWPKDALVLITSLLFNVARESVSKHVMNTLNFLLFDWSRLQL